MKKKYLLKIKQKKILISKNFIKNLAKKYLPSKLIN